MNDHNGAARRVRPGQRRLPNPLASSAWRQRLPSMSSTTLAHVFRRAPEGNPPPEPQRGAREERRETATARLDLSRGAAFAGYTILRQLGAGGMAEVYLALHPRLPRRDVIKVLAEAITADSDFRKRFNREADLAATLWHPHIVGVHDRGEFNGQLWIAMDYVEGTDASRLVKESYPDGMPVQDVCAILTAVAGALDYAHDRGLLHRDVKPANILLTHPEHGERRILLADFGVARHLGDISGITQTNVAVGTVAYAAPEQLTGLNIDGRADQYALAATAFHLLTGAPPFRHPNSVAVIGRHLHDAPPRLSDHRPELAPLDDVFCRALAKDPEARFERCRAFAAAFREQLGGVCDVGAESGAPTGTARRGVLSNLADKFSTRTRVAAALVCAVLVAVAATWSMVYSFEPDNSQAKPALAANPAAPQAAPAPIVAAGTRVLNGTYRLDYDRSKRTSNGLGIRHNGASTDWWAFHSVCTTNGCAATGIQLDNSNHLVASTAQGGQTDTLRFVAGYWQGTPQRKRVDCRQPNAPRQATQQETMSWSLAPQSDGTLRGVETETVLSNECGAQGAVLRVPVIASRVGDVPPGLTWADPAQVLSGPATPTARPSPPVLGGACTDVDKLSYDQTSNEQVVCEGGTWSKAPITTGVHAAGSSCDRPDIAVFAMSASNDGYLIECDPVTRTWARHH